MLMHAMPYVISLALLCSSLEHIDVQGKNDDRPAIFIQNIETWDMRTKKEVFMELRYTEYGKKQKI